MTCPAAFRRAAPAAMAGRRGKERRGAPRARPESAIADSHASPEATVLRGARVALPRSGGARARRRYVGAERLLVRGGGLRRARSRVAFRRASLEGVSVGSHLCAAGEQARGGARLESAHAHHAALCEVDGPVGPARRSASRRRHIAAVRRATALVIARRQPRGRLRGGARAPARRCGGVFIAAPTVRGAEHERRPSAVAGR